MLPAIGLVLLVGLAGGLYPAFFLSRFQPAQVLKANRSAAETAGLGAPAHPLVVTQFAVSIGLIICTAVIYAQTVYARTVDPGFKRDGLIQVSNWGFAACRRISRERSSSAFGASRASSRGPHATSGCRRMAPR